MSKRTDKRTGHAAAAIAATILVASCSPDFARDGAIGDLSLRQLGAASVTDVGMSPHAAIERRHFDIYDHFRKVSAQGDVAASVRPQDDDEGIRHAAMREDGPAIDLIPACSMRAMLAGE